MDGIQTDLRLYQGEDWEVSGHVGTPPRPCDHEVDRATVRARRVGWLDQRGRVWASAPPSTGFNGGSLTPLLIAVPCD